MYINPWAAIVVILAIFRLSLWLVYEKSTEDFRVSLGVLRTDEGGVPLKWLARVISCFWCTSLWLSYLIGWLMVTDFWILLLPVATSGASIAIFYLLNLQRYLRE